MKALGWASAVLVASMIAGCGSAEPAKSESGGTGGTGGGVPCQGEPPASPEQVVQAFFDALVQGDRELALTYVPDDFEERHKFDLEWAKYAEWTFKEADVVGIDRDYVSVHLVIELSDGSTDEFTDEATVEMIGCRWWVVGIPT